jgi:hypothetical protein
MTFSFVLNMTRVLNLKNVHKNIKKKKTIDSYQNRWHKNVIYNSTANYVYLFRMCIISSV